MVIDSDIIIIGSGVGGATVAKELAKNGKKILLIEKGQYFPLDTIGSQMKALRFYDKLGVGSRTKEGVIYYRAIMGGGTSIISCGNGVRSLEKELKNLGIDISKELKETEAELNIKPVPESHIGNGTKKIIDAANRIGFQMHPMPKYINFEKCISCGRCVLGCCPDAKWTAMKYLKESENAGAHSMGGMSVSRVLTKNNKAIGVECRDKTNKKIEFFANTIVLSAGGIGTPIILQKSGIEAGQRLFLDLFNVTVGITKDIGSSSELTMASVYHNEKEGFLLSPFIDCSLALISTVYFRDIFKAMRSKRMLGIMTKIKDDSVGKVDRTGVVEKRLTSLDTLKLHKGAEASKQILVAAGVAPKSIFKTKIRGAHPGGTAAIGEVVNKNLETKIKGLYVCDASVLPEAPGLPPIVTLIALAKKFAKNLYSA